MSVIIDPSTNHLPTLPNNISDETIDTIKSKLTEKEFSYLINHAQLLVLHEIKSDIKAKRVKISDFIFGSSIHNELFEIWKEMADQSAYYCNLPDLNTVTSRINKVNAKIMKLNDYAIMYPVQFKDLQNCLTLYHRIMCNNSFELKDKYYHYLFENFNNVVKCKNTTVYKSLNNDQINKKIKNGIKNEEALRRFKSMISFGIW